MTEREELPVTTRLRRELASLTLLSLFALGGLAACPDVRADDLQNLEFTGILVVPPPCTIDDDGLIPVDFGDKVGIRKVASGIYRETVSLNLKCDENSLSWQLMLSVRGNPASFDADNATVVTPQQADLGVKLFQDGKPFVLDSAVKVNGTTLPKIEALLVQRDGVELQEGEFTAQATLRAEYQ
ncbi:fimbrial protein (plasmid) [Enterobacter sp. JS8-1]|uniref:fimbrial protein n=1 Tax=Enterobacter sp. JS8-1 TaxID=3411633 RepID=UPI003B9E9C39